MDNPRISLAIFGNQNSNSGFQPLYWINSPAQQLVNLVPPGMEDNAYFFVVQAKEIFTQYTLIQNHVSSAGASRTGVLKMAVSIPAGYQLDNDMSPMMLLLDIREAFLRECMTQKSSLSQVYNFNDDMADEQIFIDIINRYPLVHTGLIQHPMQGTTDAVMLIDAEKTALFMKDPQYEELKDCGQLIVSESGNTSTYDCVITGLAIPKPAPELSPVSPPPSDQDTPSASSEDETTEAKTKEASAHPNGLRQWFNKLLHKTNKEEK